MNYSIKLTYHLQYDFIFQYHIINILIFISYKTKNGDKSLFDK